MQTPRGIRSADYERRYAINSGTIAMIPTEYQKYVRDFQRKFNN